MAKKKRKSNKKNPEVTERNKRLAIGSAVVIGAASVFVGTAMGVGELDARAATMVASSDPVVRVDFPINQSGESWMPNHEQSRIETLVAKAVVGTRALNITALKEVGTVLIDTGWAEGTPTIRWTPDGEIHAKVDWRRPAAVVRAGPTEVVIDLHAHRLPLAYPIAKSNQFYFVNALNSMPQLGQQWAGEDIRDGLALRALLGEKGLLGQVEGIDLGEGRENGTLSILTTRGTRIVWGGGPGHDLPGEQTTSTKIGRLIALFDETRRIDGSVQLIDIRGVNITLMRRED